MNFQNIPRDDKVIKRAFLPKLEALCFFDFSQIEPRLLAYYMSLLGDDSMAAAYRAGDDVYRRLAADVFGKAPADVTDEERQITKRLFLSIMYGGGTRTVMTQGHTQERAKRLISAFYNALPGIRLVSNPRPKNDGPWSRRWTPGGIEERLEERGYIESLYGRKLYPEQWGEHKMLNKLIQGSAADILKQAMLRIDERLKSDPTTEAHMVSVVHDEAQIDANKVDIPWLAREIPALMEDPIVAKVVPLPVEMEVTYTSWADKAPYLGEA